MTWMDDIFGYKTNRSSPLKGRKTTKRLNISSSEV